MGRVRYDEKKIARTKARLVSNAGYVKPTAEAEDISRDTVRRWNAGEYPPHIDRAELERVYEEESRELSNKLSRLANSSLDHAAEIVGDLKSAKDAAITAAIAIDKAQLLRGKPTERTELVDFVSWLRQPPTDRAKSGTSGVLEPTASVLPVVKQN